MFPRWLILGLILFLASAALAAGVAPQPAVAWPRFVGLVLAAVLALAVSLAPRRWTRHTAALYPLLAAPATVGGMTLLYGAYWSRNTVGGVAALALPFAVVTALKPPGRVWRWVAIVAGLLLVALLGRSGSRGAFLGLLVSSTVAALWWASRRWGERRLPVFAAVVGALVVVGILGLSLGWAWVAPLIDGVDVGGSDMGRLSIWRETGYLIGQAPFTGWGPGAFEGAFALYGRLIRVPLYSYAHQLYLGLAFEQGLGGLLIWLGLQLAAVIALLRADVTAGEGVSDPYRLAALVCTLTLAVHGLVDDPVYAGGAVPFLFVWAGLAALLSSLPARASRPAERLRPPQPGQAAPWILGGVGVILFAGLGVLARAPLQALWLTERAVLGLNVQELADWPTIGAVTDPAPARADFDDALHLNPDQVGGRFRRGLLALNGGDYATALEDLERAYAQAPDSRAVIKALGYARLWSNDVAGAAALLGGLPEIPVELQAYAGYWDSQGQPALGQLARRLADELGP